MAFNSMLVGLNVGGGVFFRRNGNESSDDPLGVVSDNAPREFGGLEVSFLQSSRLYAAFSSRDVFRACSSATI